MCNGSRVIPLKLVVNNSQATDRKEYLLAKAFQAYWRAREDGAPAEREKTAIEFLTPLRTGSPRGLAHKAQILENMVETGRSPDEIAQFAASLAGDALNMSRSYLRGPV